MEDLQILQNKAGKGTCILGMPMRYSATEALRNLQWSQLLYM